MSKWGPQEWIGFIMIVLVCLLVASRVSFWLLRNPTFALMVRAIGATFRSIRQWIYLTLFGWVHRYFEVRPTNIIQDDPALMSRSQSETDSESGIAPNVVPPAESDVVSVATPTTPNNEALRVAQIETIARLILASRQKPLANGKIPETWALEMGLGVKASSTSKAYQDARAQLQLLLATGEDRPVFWDRDEKGKPVFDPNGEPVKVPGPR